MAPAPIYDIEPHLALRDCYWHPARVRAQPRGPHSLPRYRPHGRQFLMQTLHYRVTTAVTQSLHAAGLTSRLLPCQWLGEGGVLARQKCRFGLGLIRTLHPETSLLVSSVKDAVCQVLPVHALPSLRPQLTETSQLNRDLLALFAPDQDMSSLYVATHVTGHRAQGCLW